MAKTKLKNGDKIEGITIYGIYKNNDEIMYVGSTDRGILQRGKEHFKSLDTNKHCNKTLQKAYNEIKVMGLDPKSIFSIKPIIQLPVNNTLIQFFVEMLVNSALKPKTNRCIIAQGRMRISLQRCDKDFAVYVIDCIKKYYETNE